MTKILAIQGSNLKKINLKTDTTILLATEAQKRGYKKYYFEPKNLSFFLELINSCAGIQYLQVSPGIFLLCSKSLKYLAVGN